mgnify:CR=1 FL=1|jgi:hypothetical protein
MDNSLEELALKVSALEAGFPYFSINALSDVFSKYDYTTKKCKLKKKTSK